MSKINQQYEKLTFEQEIGQSGNMLSGWQCQNPFVEELLTAVRNRSSKMDYKRYMYFDEDEKLLTKISTLHKKLDGVQPSCVLCGSGSTALLFTFITHLKNLGIKKVFYISPIYFTMLPALQRYGIQTKCVSQYHPYEKEFELNLPEGKQSVLLLSDPTWYSGTAISSEIMKELIEWQNRTSSYIFVDGSMQYLSWNKKTNEASSKLNPSLTFRLLCPTKQLAVNGFRFSYLLFPESHYRKLAWTYANIYGSASVESIAFAYESILRLSNRKISERLINLSIERHSQLRQNKIIESEINPDCGYFVFEKIKKIIPEKHLVVNGNYFGQNNFKDYTKINLLSPSLNILKIN
jgi:aspartate/methionine/tyrosine aminotransferase